MVSTSAVVVIALLGVTLSACGSTDDPGEGATSASPTSPASASSSESSVGWHPAKDDGGQFLVPPDWDVEEGPTGLELQAPPQREGGARVGGGTFTSNPTLDSEDAIDSAAEVSLKFSKKAGQDKVERLPDVTLGGVRFYHVRGENDAQWVDEYGTVHNEQLVGVLWMFNRGMVDRKQTDEMINQVMSTFEPAS